MFGRRKKMSSAEDAADAADAAGEAEQVVDADAADEAERVRLEPEPRPDGPWDSTEVGEPGEGVGDLAGRAGLPLDAERQGFQALQ